MNYAIETTGYLHTNILSLSLMKHVNKLHRNLVLIVLVGYLLVCFLLHPQCSDFYVHVRAPCLSLLKSNLTLCVCKVFFFSLFFFFPSLVSYYLPFSYPSLSILHVRLLLAYVCMYDFCVYCAYVCTVSMHT